MNIIKTFCRGSLTFCLITACFTLSQLNSTVGQVSSSDQEKRLLHSVRYQVLTQQWLPVEERKRFLAVKVRLRFSNEGKEPIMYLADNIGTISPTGPRVYRRAGEKEWHSWVSRHEKENPPGSEFSGDKVRWLVLFPGDAIECDALDTSTPDEEHAFTAFVKPYPDGKLIEIISDIYRPLGK